MGSIYLLDIYHNAFHVNAMCSHSNETPALEKTCSWKSHGSRPVYSCLPYPHVYGVGNRIAVQHEPSAFASPLAAPSPHGRPRPRPATRGRPAAANFPEINSHHRAGRRPRIDCYTRNAAPASNISLITSRLERGGPLHLRMPAPTPRPPGQGCYPFTDIHSPP